jgi:hypothetical protein
MGSRGWARGSRDWARGSRGWARGSRGWARGSRGWARGSRDWFCGSRVTGPRVEGGLGRALLRGWLNKIILKTGILNIQYNLFTFFGFHCQLA